MNRNEYFTKVLYIFLFTNSVVSGLFGIFLPLILFNIGYSFSDISFFIVLMSLSFFFSMMYLERVISKYTISSLAKITFISYLFFITSVIFFGHISYFFYISAILGGFYSCFFWVIYRLFFLNTLSDGHIGRKFANIQVFILIVSQIAIIVGSFLLEKGGFKFIYGLSLLLMFVSLFYLSKNEKGVQHYFERYKPLSFKSILKFDDEFRSKFIFLLDGAFLFLESYYWLLIIFLFTDFNFFSSGLILIFIGLFFAVIYAFIRKIIDETNLRFLFSVSVILYSFSWILRVIFDLNELVVLQYVFIAFAGFFSLLFRLVYNKVFFQIAQKTSGFKYIFMKSYYSQISIAFAFAVFGILFLFYNNDVVVFKYVFLVASIFSFLYFYQRI